MKQRIKIQMKPDYGNALFWDEEGGCTGGSGSLFIEEVEITLSNISGLKKWYDNWDTESLYQTHHWNDTQWREWWAKGLELAKAVNELLPENVDLYYFTIKAPKWKVRPEDTNDGGLFNEGEPLKILKSGEYVFECYIMPWTENEIGPNSIYNENNPIEVSMELSYSDIQSIVDMINWAWEKDWIEHSPSETLWSKLLEIQIPQLYEKVHTKAHQYFCEKYPNSHKYEGFGIYEIFCPDEIVDFASYSRADYYLK